MVLSSANHTEEVLIAGPRRTGVWILAMCGFALGTATAYAFPPALSQYRSPATALLILLVLFAIFRAKRLTQLPRPHSVKHQLRKWIVIEFVLLVGAAVVLIPTVPRLVLPVATIIIGLHLVPIGKAFGLHPYIAGGLTVAVFGVIGALATLSIFSTASKSSIISMSVLGSALTLAAIAAMSAASHQTTSGSQRSQRNGISSSRYVTR